MNPDGDEAFKLVFGQVDISHIRAMLDEVAEWETEHTKHYQLYPKSIWDKEDLINLGIQALPVAKYDFGDVVITRTGTTGTVEETFYDRDVGCNIVVFSNNDTHKESDLSLICSAI